jgi:type VI secretion system protein ImpC
MADPKAQAEQAGAEALGAGELDALLSKEFKPKTDEAKEAVQQAVRTLAEQALSQTALISTDVVASIEAIIAELDRALTKQINHILHHEDLQKLEGAWRGLHYLVNNTETDEMLKIRVLNISKLDLGKTLKRYKGTAWDQSPLFKRIYEAEYGQFGGEPFGCLVGDYHFDQSPPDVELLGEIARTSAAAHCPFIAGASPTVSARSMITPVRPTAPRTTSPMVISLATGGCLMTSTTIGWGAWKITIWSGTSQIQ